MAESGQFGAVVLANVHVHRSPFVASPVEVESAGHSRRNRRGEQLEGSSNGVSLLFDVVGATRWITKWVVDENKTRHTDGFDNVLGAANNDGSDAGLFEGTCNQTHGLVTHRSKRNQNHGVDAIFLCARDDFGRVGMGAALRFFRRHAIEALADAANDSLFSQ